MCIDQGQYQYLVPLEPLNNIFWASICLPLKYANISIHQMSGLQFWQVLIGSRNSQYPLFWDGIQNGFSFHDILTVYYCPTVVSTRHPLERSFFFQSTNPEEQLCFEAHCPCHSSMGQTGEMILGKKNADREL